MITKIICFLFLIEVVRCEVKSSLTFVIDDTFSMSDDIDAVKSGANAIFDTVMNSNASQIEDFVLVTFNDPIYKYRITTKDRDEFKRELSAIEVYGGGDCPEMAMSGIESAIENSRPSSLLYVFTDASAKDPDKYDNVKNLAQKKQIQVVFVLTGDCNGLEGSEAVYYNLAKDTSGEVFHLKKSEVKDILKYVESQINNRKEVLVIKQFPRGTHKFDYTVDSTMKELVISVSGSNPKMTVIDPDGETAPTKDLIRTEKIAIVKVIEVKPGVYSAEVTSSSETSVKVTAETTVHFQHGFSPVKSISIEETVTRPIPDEPSHLSIKLTTDGDKTIKLDTVQIIDMDNNILVEAPLTLVAEENKFYVTDRFSPPHSTFRIVIHGRDINNNKEISRMSLTPVAPQVLDKTIPNKSPEINLVGDGKVVAEFSKPLELKVKISGYPKPDTAVSQTEDDRKIYLGKPELLLIEHPYNYIATFKVDRVSRNSTYTFLANNSQGEDEKSIEVTVINKNYFKVLKTPKDNSIELGNSAVFECHVDAYPPADIKWYKHDTEVKSYANILISEDKTHLSVVNMLPELRGKYVCETKNEETTKSFDFHLHITGAEAPEIDKTISDLSVREGTSVDIPCILRQGKPKPEIDWYLRRTRHLIKIPETKVHNGTIHIDKFDEDSSGLYICKARNGMGIDEHRVELRLAYPPHIYGSKYNNMVTKPDERVILSCRAEGTPEPDVIWLKDNAELELTTKYKRSYSDKGISFIATEADSGVYTCKASNINGIDWKNYNVTIFKPVTIEVPEESSFFLKIGDSSTLTCIADGLPKPKITWIHRSFDNKARPQVMGHDSMLDLRRVQVSEQGYYTCVASNVGSSVNITYEVKVLAPPMIENIYPETAFYAVVGDKTLRIPCNATGNPKPDVSWIKEGIDKVPIGTEWYDQEKDGTLIIKNVDKMSAGAYICLAVNAMGSDNETYEVIVEPYPRRGSPTRTILVEEGKSTKLNCEVPHIMLTDDIRWYKDGLMLSTLPEHHILNAKATDSGIYTCRVSNFAKSRSGNIRVNVGAAPRFTNDETLKIDYVRDVAAVMDCSSEGNPIPEVSWWHNGEKLPVLETTYIIDSLTPDDKGKYYCIVKNEFGQIIREFNIVKRDCSIDIKSELTGNQPMILSSRPSYITGSLTWTTFETEEGNLTIPPGEYIRLQCPNGFKNLYKTEIIATCEKENNFDVEGTLHKFSELKCSDDIRPAVKRTGKVCVPSNFYSEAVKVGYETARSDFLDVYEVCLDMSKSVPIYAKYKIQGTMAGVALENVTKSQVDTSVLPSTFDNNDDMYDCSQQNAVTSRILERPFHQEDGCCFLSRQLVSSKDVGPGLPQKATFSDLNIVPQWSSCNTQNWVQIERRIRNLARSTSESLDVWTGVSQQQLQISNKNIYLHGSEYYPVPKYLWKVVQNPSTKASLAIVQLNIPDLTLTDAYRNMFCRDICNEVTWMRSRRWRDVKRGYTFCCNIQDFERVFGYEGVFNGTGKVLYDVSFVAERTLI